MSDSTKAQKIVRFLFEMGTMRKLPRIHRQTLLTDDTSDTIASHSYRVTLIGWFLAKLENVDPYKVVMMCLAHDMSEARTGDHNWVHKRYTKIFEEEVREEQLGTLPFTDLMDLAVEYDTRSSPEAIVAKDADLLDQIFLLREYVWQGNQEAQLWLDQKDVFARFKTENAKILAQAIMAERPSSWFDNLSTNINR
jgi:putative hydrolases of HD superfamily